MIVVFLIAQLGVALRINHLNKTFYDIWSDPGRHDLQEAYAALMPFVLTGCLLVPEHPGIICHLKVRVLVARSSDIPLSGTRKDSTAQIEGSSQRIQEDVARFTKVMETIALTVVSSIFTLIGFVPILWASAMECTVIFLSAIPVRSSGCASSRVLADFCVLGGQFQTAAA